MKRKDFSWVKMYSQLDKGLFNLSLGVFAHAIIDLHERLMKLERANER